MKKLTTAQLTYLDALRSLSVSGASVRRNDVDKVADAVSGTGKHWNHRRTVEVLVAGGLVSEDVRWTALPGGGRVGTAWLSPVG